VDILLIRHAEAGERDPTKFPNDDLRPVTPSGRRKMTRVVRAMHAMGIEFEYLVSSPLVRAMETAEIVAEVFDMNEPPQVDEALGKDCSAESVLKLLGRYPPGASVALVGHEPAFSKVAAALTGVSADAHIELKKGGTAGIGFEGAAALGKGRLMYLLKPGQLKRLAKD
jgi:phosphohistidine phosphatase